MINATFYEPLLHKLWQHGKIAIVQNKPCLCSDTNCYDCDFGKTENPKCREKLSEWMLQEHDFETVEWNKVPVDSKILVLIGGVWTRRHFASYDPVTQAIKYYVRGMTSYTALSCETDRVSRDYVKLMDCEV